MQDQLGRSSPRPRHTSLTPLFPQSGNSGPEKSRLPRIHGRPTRLPSQELELHLIVSEGEDVLNELTDRDLGTSIKV